MTLGEVVEDRHLESPVDQFFHADAADVSGSARYEYFFHFRFLELKPAISSDNQIRRPAHRGDRR
jgi:hypothetical protein